MRIQYLNGGLANQVFQYIFARYAEMHYPEGGKVYLDDSFFFYNNVHNGYELEKVFGIKANLLSEYFTPDVWEIIVEKRKNGTELVEIFKEFEIDYRCIFESSDIKEGRKEDGIFTLVPIESYYPDITETADNVYYKGWWINRKWFDEYKDIFFDEFKFAPITDKRNLEYIKEIKNTMSVAVHVRRGDYVRYNICLKEDFYTDSIDIVLKGIPDSVLFVFSDDIEWCKQNYKNLGLDKAKRVVYIEGNMGGNNYIDLQLMTMCKGVILSNSAFSYLGGLLNRDKLCWINFNNREL